MNAKLESTTSTPLLEVQQLVKRYTQDESVKKSFCLGPVDFSLVAGETIAFLGRNGAGKSTLFQLITANLDASSGTIRFLGHRFTPDQAELKRSVGYLPQNVFLPRWATGHEILQYAAKLYGLQETHRRVEEAEAYWDCLEFRHKPLAALSYGMQKRVGLALATLADPPLLVLDEPWSGLDVYQVRALDEALLRRQQSGKTSIISTHVAAYVAKLCQRVYLIQAGQCRTLEAFAPSDWLTRMQLIEDSFFSPSSEG